MTTHNPSDRVQAVFQDARALQADALEMMALGKVRNAAEKAWGATKRATDALVLARRDRRGAGADTGNRSGTEAAGVP